MNNFKILVACEESGRVTEAFRNKGFQAFSCDLIPTSGNMPAYHIIGDALEVMQREKWDCVIAFPPCTYLTVSGNRWFNIEKYGDAAIERHKRRQSAIEFFLEFATANITHIAIENPIGIMSRIYRKPDCIIEPWQFGEPYAKHTCLWLKNLPVLKPTHVLQKPPGGWLNQHFTTVRSKTFEGIAWAMAEQWGEYFKELYL